MGSMGMVIASRVGKTLGLEIFDDEKLKT